MSFSVVREFKTRGMVQRIGTVLELSEGQAAKLTGYVVPVIDVARRLFQEIKARDPGGDCWQWMQRNRPELWRSHIKSLLENDLGAAAGAFRDMIRAWEQSDEQEALFT